MTARKMLFLNMLYKLIFTSKVQLTGSCLLRLILTKKDYYSYMLRNVSSAVLANLTENTS